MREPTILCFAGASGSGKSTLGREIGLVLAWPVASFGEHVRAVTKHRGLSEDRHTLQDIGQELIDNGWEAFCAAVLADAGWKDGLSVVVDGVRHKEALQTLKKLAPDSTVLLVFIDVSASQRAERLITRDRTRQAELAQLDQHPVEDQVNSTLASTADLVIDGSRPLQELARELLDWLDNLDGR